MNKIDELLKIKELLDSGIISEIEFKELKNNLMKLDVNAKIINENSLKDNNYFYDIFTIRSKIINENSLEDNIIPKSNSKIKYVFFGIIICIMYYYLDKWTLQ